MTSSVTCVSIPLKQPNGSADRSSHPLVGYRPSPFSGRIVPELAESELREVIVGDYRVIYEVTEGNTVEILTIVHSKRLFPHPREFRG